MSSGRSNEKRFRKGRSNQPVRDGATSLNSFAAAPQNSIHPTEFFEQTDASPAETPPAESFDDSINDQFDSQIAETLSKYQSDLIQKDELITALIHELEQAVEQLDRFERVGADRSHSGNSASAINPGFDIAGMKLPFMDDFQRMVSEWEQAQPVSLLGRIESQLSAVHDLVLNLHRSDRVRGDHGESHHRDDHDRDDERHNRHEDTQDTEQDTVNMTLDESSPSWEAIKNQLFGVPTPPEPQSQETRNEEAELLRLMSETPTPDPVDFNHATVEDLKKAINDRDSYIIQLNRLFRTRNLLALPTDWAVLANVPGDMQVRVESLIQHLDVQVRLGEVEMSLERARLARERSQIQSEREHIEKHLRRLGLNSIAELDNISEAKGTSGDRRWMRFLGPNTK